jgi:DNA polymerase sigma
MGKENQNMLVNGDSNFSQRILVSVSYQNRVEKHFGVGLMEFLYLLSFYT